MASCSTNSYDGRLATLTVTVASQSIENNQTTLSWELKVSGGKVNNYNAYDITAWVGGTDNAHRVYGPVDKAWDSYAFPAVKGTKTGTVVIDHNADGTHGQVQIRIRGSFYNNNPTNHDAYLDIPTIPRASNVSCDNVTLGNSVTINCPRASTGFTNTLYIKDGNTTIETFSGVGDSKSWTPTLANYGNRIALSKQFTIQCDTYSGGTYIGTKYCYPTLSFPSGYGPTCSLSVSPNNSNCPSAWGNRYVQYKSMVNVSVGFSGQYGATLSSRTSSVPNAGTNSSASWISNTLSTSGTLTVTASVTDNRNRTGNASQQITVYPYFSPRITRALAERNDNTLTCTYSYEIASVNGANAHNFKIEYKKVSDSTWTTAVNNTSDLSKTNATATVNNLDANSSYDIRFTVTDSTGSITQTASVGTAFDLMNFHSSGLAMAIGKMSEAGANEKLFEVGIPSIMSDGKMNMTTYRGGSGNWIAGRKNATIFNNIPADTGWHPVCAVKSKTGDWQLGCLGNEDILRAVYFADSKYPSTNSTTYNLMFPTKSGTIATTGDIPSVGNGTITMQINGSNKGTFTTNQSGNTTINMGSGYAATSSLPTYGSNSNGHYIRFPNIKVQICWHYLELTTSSTTSSITTSGNVYYVDGTWTFPAAFSGTPVVNVTSTDRDTGVFGADINKSDTNPIGPTSCLVTAYGPAKSRKTGVQLIAIGTYS